MSESNLVMMNGGIDKDHKLPDDVKIRRQFFETHDVSIKDDGDMVAANAIYRK